VLGKINNPFSDA